VQIQKYRARISGPLLDRMDLQLEVHPVDLSAFRTTLSTEEKSMDVKKRILKARDIQLERAKTYNAYLSATQIDRFCYLNAQEQQWLHKACDQLQISARAYHKILKIARTIADLSGESCCIQRQHLMEAMQYRCFDRTWQ
jgi:magnesium chelatase family protein